MAYLSELVTAGVLEWAIFPPAVSPEYCLSSHPFPAKVGPARECMRAKRSETRVEECRQTSRQVHLILRDHLWAAADKLRGNRDAAEYKHVALGLIFLKYISDRFEERRAKALADAEEAPLVDERDLYIGDNVFWVPEKARWEFLKANATSTEPTISERLDETLRRYHNRAVDSLQVIEELIGLAKDIRAANARSVELGLSTEELAFYDALAENGSAKALMAHEQLRLLAQMLVRTIRSSATIDWTQKESVRAKMRIEVRKLLARYGYPPDLQKAAVDLVVRQAEVLATDWA